MKAGPGRPPKEKSFANMLNIALTAKGETGQTKLREVAEILVTKALNGDNWAIGEIANRTDGKAFQQIEMTGEDGGALKVEFITRRIIDPSKS